MDTIDFLAATITSPQGWLNIAASEQDGSGWRQYWRAWPDDKESAVELIQALKDSNLNVYYSAHLFSTKSTEKKYVIDTRTIFCDLDSATLSTIAVQPSMIVKSSDDKHQAYWFLREIIPIDELEEISRRVTYGIVRSDHTGWWRGHMMRVPNTLNHKYSPAERVRVISKNSRVYNAGEFNSFAPIEESVKARYEIDDEWIEDALRVKAGHKSVSDLWDTYKARVAQGTDVHMYTEAADRSNALFRLNCELFRAGASVQEVYVLAYHSKNNKFANLRYNAERELAKDVLRAKIEVERGPQGIRTHINIARHQGGTLAERRQLVADLVRNQMLSHGSFIHVRGGSLWYVLAADGRPVPISRSSIHLNVILDTMFGLVSTEPEHNYVVAHLINYTANLPPNGEMGALSYYVHETNTMLLHTGTKTLVRITEETIDTVTNGWHGIIFPWSNDGEFSPDIGTKTQGTWSDYLFDGALDNLATDGLTTAQATALLRAWFMSILLRNCIVSRPILAIFGQPGSGKSTLFRRIYALLYGPHKAVSGITNAEDFDFQLASDPLVVIDNVDTWERWLPDRIARAAALSEIKRRKLYTDTDTITVRSQAMLGITAHNPKFGREDVTDRLILITLERLRSFKSESEIIARITNMRDDLWGLIAHDIQRILREPNPTCIPQFRVEDFARLGQRIANALGFTNDFYSAIESMVSQQKGFVLEEDSMLVDLISKYVKNPRNKSDEFKTPAKLWGQWDVLSGGDRNFQKQYGNSIKLGKKIWVMVDALKQRFVVEWKFDSATRVRMWKFTEKAEGQNENKT